MAKIGIFVGTVYGNALLIAEEINTILSENNHETTIYEDPNIFDWKKYESEYVLIITSTTGSGDLPDNILPLFYSIKTEIAYQYNLKYGIIALGDSSYVNFCGGGKKFDQLLQKKRLKRLGELLFIDANDSSIEPKVKSNSWVKHWITLIE